MLQDVFLFSGTIRSNIVLREEGIPDSEIMEVCRYVNADKFINKLDHGLDEEVRERGNNFSAGQRQLLSFARTIIHKPSVMILHRARVIADYVMDLYVNGELDEVYLVYTKMENSFSMNAEKEKLLPLAKEDFIHPAPADIYQEEIKVESSMEEILEHVVPNCVTGYIYGALVESFASEHNSRMMAMQTATDSAKAMISELSIEYNRVRQAAITQQITDARTRLIWLLVFSTLLCA